MTRFIAMLSVLLTFSFSGFAQESQLLYSDATISISTSRAICSDVQNGIEKEFVMITITNSSASEITIHAKKESWYNGSCKTCENDSPEFHINVHVAPNSTMQGTCDNSTDQLRVFAGMPNLSNTRKLSHFELKDIQISGN
jgi:hypothetical protein